MKLDEIVAQMLALPPADRAKLVVRLQASLVNGDDKSAAPAPTRLLDLAGSGRGLWGDDSDEYLRRLRDEWH